MCSIFKDRSFTPDGICAQLKKGYDGGARLFLCDGVTDEDLSVIAAGVVKSEIPFITSDPGPFTAQTARLLEKGANSLIPYKEEGGTAQKGVKPAVLAVVGSVNAVAARQFDAFLERYDPMCVFVHTNQGAFSGSKAKAG